jgi:hypothetical protein
MRNRTLLRTLYAFPLFFVTVLAANAQIGLSTANSRFEIGINVGPMNFLGDLGGNKGKGTLGPKDNDLPVTNIIGGISASYYPSEWLGFRLAGNIGRMAGDDGYVKDHGGWEQARLYRNITFRSPLYEAYAGIEFFPTALISINNGWGLPRFRPYVIAGIGAFKFKPQGVYTDAAGNDKWIDLKPLRLEGQGMVETGIPEYKLYSYNVPVGVGIKYDITERLTFAIEFIHRKTGTDYIDDVSNRYVDPALFDKYLTPSQAAIAKVMANPSSYYPQVNNSPGYTPYRIGRPRGNPDRKDSYYSSTFRLTWKIGDVYADWFRNKNSMKCPQYF